MLLYNLFEAEIQPRVVVTYPGRFQPFHQGHVAVFSYLQKQFGANNVYVLTSDKTDTKKSPFNFNDKVTLMSYAGVPTNHIIETTNMYSLPEMFDPKTTIFITAVGSPDRDRLAPDTVLQKAKLDKQGNIIKPAGSPSYYKSWGSEKPQTADKHGYVIVIPEVEKSIKIKGKSYDVSHGTECRNLWNLVRNDNQAKVEFLQQLYGTYDRQLEQIFNKIPISTQEDLSPMGQSTISPISGNVHEEAAGVGVIASKKQKNDPRFSTSLTKDVKPGAIKRSLRAFRLAESIRSLNNELISLRTIIKESKDQQFLDQMREFLIIAMKELNVTKLPKIKLQSHIKTGENGQATFGRFVNDEMAIYLAIKDRHPVDILRTLAHELVHYKQALNSELDSQSGNTGSPQENQAHAVAGVIMRLYNKKYPAAVLAKQIL